MSNVVDERIVSMEFDNDRFQKNIAQTMQSLEDLDDQIDGAANGIKDSFIDVEDGLSRLDLVFAGFYSKIGGYLADLSVKATQFVKSMVVAPVSQGFNKYTAETLAAQTIMSNAEDAIIKDYDILGSKEEQHQQALDKTYEALQKISQYSDDTNYSVDKLQDTMSKMVMGGTNIDDAAEAVKGIGNWAAVTGAGIQKADEVMPNLVKAFNQGYLSLEQWKSVQRNSMADPVFVKKLLENARKYSDEMRAFEAKNGEITFSNYTDTKYGVFGNNRFITAQALIDTLREYGDTETEIGRKAYEAAKEAKTLKEAIDAVKEGVSGRWATSFRLIFGNYEEARSFFTFVQNAMLDIFMIGQDYRNQVLEAWHKAESGGFKDLIEALNNFWAGLKGLVRPIKDAFHEIFGFTDYKETAKPLIELTKRFKNFADSINRTYTNVWDLKKALNAAFDGKEIDDDLAERLYNYFSTEEGKSTEKLFEAMKDADFTLKAGNLWQLKSLEDKLNPGYSILTKVSDLTKGIFSTFKTGIDIIKGVGDVVGTAISSLKGLISPLFNLASSIGFVLSKINEAIKSSEIISKIFSSISRVVKSILSPAVDMISRLLDGISARIRNINNLTFFTETLTKIGNVLEKVTKFIEDLVSNGFNALSNVVTSLKIKLEPLASIFSSIGSSIKDFFSNLFSKDYSQSPLITALGAAKNFLGGIIGFLGDKILVPTVGFLVDSVTKIWEKLKSIAPTFDGIKENITKLFTTVSNSKLGDTLGSWFSGVLESLKGIGDFIVDYGILPALEFIASAIEGISKALEPLGERFENVKNSASEFVAEFRSNAVQKVTNLFTGLGNALKKVYEWAAPGLKQVFEWVKNILGVNNLVDVIKLINAILTGSILFDVKKITSGLANIGDTIRNFLLSFTTKGGSKAAKSMKDVALAMTALAIAIKIMASVPIDKFVTIMEYLTGPILTGFAVALATINGTSSFMTAAINNAKTNIFSIAPITSNIMEIGLAMLALAKALQILSKVDFSDENVQYAMEALIAFMVTLALLANKIEKVKMSKFKVFTTGLINIAIALTLMMVPIYALSKMGDDAKQGIIGVGILLAMFTLLGNALRNAKLDKVGANLLITAAAVTVLTGAVYILGSMNAAKLEQGMTALIGMAVGLSVVAAAIKIASGGLSGAGALTVLVASLYGLAGVIAIMADIMSNYGSDVWTGLLVLVAALGALTLAAVGLTFAAPGLMAFATVLNALGAAILKFSLAAGVLVLAFDALALGLVAFMPKIKANEGKIKSGLESFLSIIIYTLHYFIPSIVNELIFMVSQVIAALYEHAYDWAYQLIGVFVKLLEAVMDNMTVIVEKLTAFVVSLLTHVAQAMYDNSSILADALAKLLAALLNIVLTFLYRLWTDHIKPPLQGILDAITGFFEILWDIVTFPIRLIIEMVKSFWATITGEADTGSERISKFLSEWWDALIDKIVGWAKGLWETVTGWWNKIVGLFKKDTKENQGAIADAAGTGAAIGGAYVGAADKAVNEGMPELADSAEKGGENAADSFTNKYETEIEDSKFDIMSAYKEATGTDAEFLSFLNVEGSTGAGAFTSGYTGKLGSTQTVNSIKTAAGRLGTISLNALKMAIDSHSPSKETEKIGGYFTDGFILGLEALVGTVQNKATNLGDSALASLDAAIQNGPSLDLLDMGDPVIRPVLDLSDVRAGMSELPSLFGNRYSLGLAASAVGATGDASSEPPAITINVYSAEGQSEEAIANNVMKRLNSELKSRGSVWR